jgi:hypothetical protein
MLPGRTRRSISRSGAGVFAFSDADLYNRQLHPDEKAAIHNKANGDTAEEKKLTRAACYAVKCWAEYPVGSAAYSANYVSPEQAAQLTTELAWVNSQCMNTFTEKEVVGLSEGGLGQGLNEPEP